MYVSYELSVMGAFFFLWGSLRVGITIPTIEVHFEHLNVETEAHVGSRALPTVLNFPVNIVEVTKCNTIC